MKELSLNILDIAMNSVRAGATKVEIRLTETDETLTIAIADDGCGMSPEFLANVLDPFSTTRTTRKVGLGLPLLKMEAEQTGGTVTIESREAKTHPDDHGTVTTAVFYKNNIDFTPLGDVVSSVVTLIQGRPGLRWIYVHETPSGAVDVDTDEMRAVLGDDARMDDPDILAWLDGYLRENYAEISYPLD